MYIPVRSFTKKIFLLEIRRLVFNHWCLRKTNKRRKKSDVAIPQTNCSLLAGYTTRKKMFFHWSPFGKSCRWHLPYPSDWIVFSKKEVSVVDFWQSYYIKSVEKKWACFSNNFEYKRLGPRPCSLPLSYKGELENERKIIVMKNRINNISLYFDIVTF